MLAVTFSESLNVVKVKIKKPNAIKIHQDFVYHQQGLRVKTGELECDKIVVVKKKKKNPKSNLPVLTHDGYNWSF